MDFRISHLSFVCFFAFLTASSPRLFADEPLRRPDALGAQLYSIGQPSAEEQLYLEYINRARANPTAEGVRLASTTDANVRGAYQNLGVNLTLMQAQLAAILPQPPLSMNATLTSIARAHSQDMFANRFQGHVGSNGSTTQSRIIGSGYTANAGYFFGENVFSYALSVPYGHAGFEVDWGGTPATGGMQVPPGHRQAIHSANYREVGLGVVLGSNQSVGPQLVTQDFGSRSDALPLVTGVVYRDANGNGFYDVGEGVGGVTVTIAGSDHYAISAGSGGYSVPVPQNGIYTVTFSGGSTPSATRTVAVTGGQNVKLDYLPVDAQSLSKADFNRDGSPDILWQNRFDGSRFIWLLTGTAHTGGVPLEYVSIEWEMVGVADFNRDGHTDILWQNRNSGQRFLWFMTGTAHTGGMDLGYVAADWDIVGADDFNGDGHADILWQNRNSGQRYIWLMTGAAHTGGVDLGAVANNWDIVGTGDFNRDGNTDILWQNRVDGSRFVWLMTGAAHTGGVSLGSVATEWDMVGVADFNRDGHADILWQNRNSGQRYIWLMTATAHTGNVDLGHVAPAWDIRNR